MRKLLEKWATLEPALCRLSSLKPEDFELLNDPKGRWWTIITEDSLMHIQAAVQDAIIARGWGFEMQFNTDWQNRTEVMVRYGVNWASSEPTDNPAEALLTAYLAAIEA